MSFYNIVVVAIQYSCIQCKECHHFLLPTLRQYKLKALIVVDRIRETYMIHKTIMSIHICIQRKHYR